MPPDPHPDRPVLSILSVLRRSDWGLFVAGTGVSVVGAMLIWSATHREAGNALAIRHLINLVIGVGIAVGISLVRHQTLRLLTPLLAAGSVIGLILVLSPLGSTINGSRSWIVLPAGFSIQPAEFAKVALVLALAMLLADRWDAGMPPDTRDVLLAWVLVAVPIGLVMLQPDLGSTIVLGALGFGVIAVAGTPKKWLALVVGLIVTGVVLALTTPLLSPYQRDRLTAFANPEADPSGIGYQTAQVRVAIGSGGWTGAGFGEGKQTQGGFIPFQETDFVFSVAGEELGLVGVLGLLALLAFLVLRIGIVGARAPDAFGRLVAAGVATWFAFQTFQNVGMNLGLMPVTGLPLPFVSYGGSSMFVCWAALGIVNTVHVAQTPGR